MAAGSGLINEDTPLLLVGRSRLGNASPIRTIGNIIVSIVGTGVLGLPYTFRLSGWAAGSLAVALSATLTYYCMVLLVRCRNKLEGKGHSDILTYGDLGNHAYGTMGQSVVDLFVVISQCGCCVAYLIFVGQNLSSIFTANTNKQALFIGILLPLQIGLGWVRSLSGLAPFSILADICNVLAMAIVIRDDFGSLKGFDGAVAFRKWSGLPFAVGVAIYCYEGFGMTLTLEASMRKPHLFPWVLAQAFLPITILYIAFGLIGYLAFRDNTRDIITLNLPNDWSTIAVKAGLCIALSLTFPVMMYPVHELLETKVLGSGYFQRKLASHPRLCKLSLDASRALTVLIVGAIAVLVPSFGVFISLVGSTVCAMLAFVFPAFFHLRVYEGGISWWQWGVDWCLIVGGVAFAVYGTYTTCVGN